MNSANIQPTAQGPQPSVQAQPAKFPKPPVPVFVVQNALKPAQKGIHLPIRSIRPGSSGAYTYSFVPLCKSNNDNKKQEAPKTKTNNEASLAQSRPRRAPHPKLPFSPT